MPAKKSRHWGAVVYPESAPTDWREQLQATGLRCAISPLHDCDADPGTGEVKKDHWHVIMCWDGPTTYNVAKAITDKLNAPIPQPLASVRGYYRYFTHMDNPDKHQYDERDIQTLNGFDYRDYVDLTRTEMDVICRQLVALVREHDIKEYATLLDLLLDDDRQDAFTVARTHTVFLAKYIESRRHRAREDVTG